MRTDPEVEATIPDSISPDDALTLALTNKHFAKHVSDLADQQSSESSGEMHHEARTRHNARLIRGNHIKPGELPKKRRRQINPQPGPSRRSLTPMWDGDQLRERLQAYDRTPFLDVLAIWMECIPTPQTISHFADKYPDRWARAMSDLGRLGGFAEKKDIDINFAAKVSRMSDSQLQDALEETAYRLGIPLPALLSMASAAEKRTEALSPAAPRGLDPVTIDAETQNPDEVRAADLDLTQGDVGQS